MSSARWVAWLLRHRRLIALVGVAVTIVTGHRTVQSYAALKSDLEELLPETAPSVAALAELRARMPGLRYLGVVIDTGGPENVPQANAAVDALARRIEAYPKELVASVHTDISRERRFAETYAFQLIEPGDVKRLREAVEERRDWQVTRALDLDLGDESDEPPPLPIDEIRKKYEAWHGTAGGPRGDRFVSEDGKTVVLLIQASSHATGIESDRALLSRVRADVRELVPSTMSVGYASDVATRVEELEGLVTDLGLSGLVVLLLVIGSIVAYFRSWRAVPILGLSLGLGTLSTFALVALPPLSIQYLNSNTAFLGSIVVGNGINSGIILLARFWEERRRGLEVQHSLSIALATTWRPTLAASLAAAVAYGSLVFTDFRGFNQFGWIGGIGMIVCWATNMVFVPPLAARLAPAVVPPMREQSLASRAGRAMLGHPHAVLIGAAALMLLAAIGLERRGGDWIEYDLSQLRRRDSWQTGERYWGKRMDDTVRRYLTPTIVMAEDAESARQIEARVRELAALDGAGGLIGSVRTIRDVLPPERAASIEQAENLAKVLTPRLLSDLAPEQRQMLERALSKPALLPLSEADVPSALLAGLSEHDGRSDRSVLVFPKLNGGTWDAARIERYAAELRTATAVGGKGAAVAGSLLLSSDIARAMRADGPRATAVALSAVVVICAVAFRRLGLAGAAILSLLSGVLLMLGFLAWTAQKLNFSNFVALPITFGIAADYSINVLKRYQSEGARVDRALRATGAAVALCSITTIIGFGSLLVAQNRALFSFGVFAVAGEITCLLAAILVLPAALELGSRRAAGRIKPVTSPASHGEDG